VLLNSSDVCRLESEIPPGSEADLSRWWRWWWWWWWRAGGPEWECRGATFELRWYACGVHVSEFDVAAYLYIVNVNTNAVYR